MRLTSRSPFTNLLLTAGLAGLLLAISPAPGEDPKQPGQWTPELQLKTRQITSVQVSPDGKRVAFAVREAVMEPEKSEYVTQIHLANTDGSDPFQLTYGDKSSDNPQWSPDSEWLAFASSRSGKSNLWLIRVRGGEAQKLTDVKTGVGSFQGSPGGKSIAFTAVDGPTPAEEKAEKEKTDARVVDENIKLNRLFVIPVEKGADGKREARQLTKGKYSVADQGRGGFDWSPDGKTIAFTHT